MARKGWLAGIVLALALLLLSVQWLAFDEAFYFSHLEKHSSYERFESRAIVDDTIDGLLDFLGGKRDSPPEIFDEFESSHLVDVRVLLDRVRIACAALFIIFSAAMVYYIYRSGKEKRFQVFSEQLQLGGLSTIALSCVLMLGAVFFQPVFIIFHRIFFPQGNWSFPMNSTLIMLFPREFFFDFFVAIILRTALLGLSVLMLGYIVQKSIPRLFSRGGQSAS